MELKFTEIYEYVKSITKKHETVCKYLNGKIYNGSRTQSLKERLQHHVTHWKAGRTDSTSFKILDAEDYKIELIEDFPCTSKNQLEKREGWYQKKYKNEIVNIVIAGRTKKEWRDDNSEKMKNYFKNRYIKNKESIQKKNRKYYESHKEQCSIKAKEWRENNKERKAKMDSEYYKNNKEKIREVMGAIETCECGGNYERSNRARHKRSQRHINFINS